MLLFSVFSIEQIQLFCLPAFFLFLIAYIGMCCWQRCSICPHSSKTQLCHYPWRICIQFRLVQFYHLQYLFPCFSFPNVCYLNGNTYFLSKYVTFVFSFSSWFECFKGKPFFLWVVSQLYYVNIIQFINFSFMKMR